MNYLYLDTSDHLILGLLDEKFNWITYEELETRKSSSVVHKKIFDILNKNKTEIKDLRGLIYCAGPGSYTGMRVSEGIGQIFRWQKVPINSFYHYEVPLILGIKEGVWLSKAFKGDYFIYRWNDDGASSKLVKKSDLPSEVDKNKKNLFTNFNDIQDLNFFLNQTSDLIKDKASEFFAHIVKNKLFQQTYYYRSLENEFRPSEEQK